MDRENESTEIFITANIQIAVGDGIHFCPLSNWLPQLLQENEGVKFYVA